LRRFAEPADVAGLAVRQVFSPPRRCLIWWRQRRPLSSNAVVAAELLLDQIEDVPYAPWWEMEDKNRRNYVSSTTLLRSTPISGTSTSTTSPGTSHFGGVWWPPAPVGVPVQIRSPGRSVVKVEM
jgi:hypothetical protein